MMSIPKVIEKFCAIPDKILMVFCRYGKIHPKVYMKSQETLNHQNNLLKRKTELEVSPLLFLKIFTKLQ